jgi:hypothetical protein
VHKDGLKKGRLSIWVLHRLRVVVEVKIRGGLSGTYPEQAISRPRPRHVGKGTIHLDRRRWKSGSNDVGVASNDHVVMPRRRQGEDEIDRPPDLAGRGFLECLAFGVQLADDLLEAVEVRLNFDQNGLIWTIEAQIDGASTWSRYGGFDRRLPARITAPEQPADDSGLTCVSDQRAGSFERREAQVCSEHGRHAKSRSKSNARVPLLELADQGATHSDRIGNGCLRDTGSKAKDAEVFGSTG